MKIKIINGIEITLTGNTISEDELTIYLNQLQAKHKPKIIKAHVDVDVDDIGVQYTLERVPFERIRRITGYLVGTTARWGDGKRAELKDRTLHN